LFPHLFEFGKFALPTYGVLAAVGLVVGLIINVNLAKRDGIDEDFSWNLGVISIIAGVIGAKVLLVINDWGYYSTHRREIFSLNILQAGGVWYGGFIAAVTCGLMYVALKRKPLLRTLDAFVPGIAFGHAVGRLGCFAAGCCYGKPTDEPWGVVFTNPLAKALVGTPLGIRMHPTQIYEFLAEMIIFAIVMWTWRHKKFSGQVFGTYAFLYGIARFWLEFYRDDPERGSVFNGLMSGTQLISIVLVIIGGLMWLKWEKHVSAASA
jgi:phosphatidylglycerol:prolipoprotein diacylglycerol transferase